MWSVAGTTRTGRCRGTNGTDQAQALAIGLSAFQAKGYFLPKKKCSQVSRYKDELFRSHETARLLEVETDLGWSADVACVWLNGP